MSIATKDQLMDDGERRWTGAFFTPAIWAAEAIKTLDSVLGPTWRQDCIVWDPATGTGNLTRDFTFDDLILSTLDQSDVDDVRASAQNPGAAVFQHDFLNPNAVSMFFEDPKDKNEIPDAVHERLRAAAKAGKRLVFLMNPPYGTANNAGTTEGDHKAGIALTAVNKSMKAAKLGACSQQLYAQFMYRCSVLAQEYGFKTHTVALFSVPTFMSSGSYKPFRDWWYNRYACQGAFLFQASHFADVSGRWGISFTIWNSPGKTDGSKPIPCTLKDVPKGTFKVEDTAMKLIYNSDEIGRAHV